MLYNAPETFINGPEIICVCRVLLVKHRLFMPSCFFLGFEKLMLTGKGMLNIRLIWKNQLQRELIQSWLVEVSLH